MPTIKIKNKTTGNWETLPTVRGKKGETGEKGEKGDNYILTDTDKEEIAKKVASGNLVDKSSFVYDEETETLSITI